MVCILLLTNGGWELCRVRMHTPLYSLRSTGNRFSLNHFCPLSMHSFLSLFGIFETVLPTWLVSRSDISFDKCDRIWSIKLSGMQITRKMTEAPRKLYKSSVIIIQIIIIEQTIQQKNQTILNSLYILEMHFKNVLRSTDINEILHALAHWTGFLPFVPTWYINKVILL